MSNLSQELRGHPSRIVLFLRKITPQVEKYCYWALSDSNKKANIKKEVALALLNKIAPQKIATEDEEGNTIPLMVYLPEIKKSESTKV